jgi:hypothetical protein
MKYFVLFIFPVLFALSSCGIDPDDINKTTATRLDSLQGDWTMKPVTLQPVFSTYAVPIVITNPGTFHLRPDHTGTTGIPPVIPVYNFTYRLLPDDSTLVINTNPAGTPSYDTNIIHLNGNELFMKTLRKQVSFLPSFAGTYNIYYDMYK